MAEKSTYLLIEKSKNENIVVVEVIQLQKMNKNIHSPSIFRLAFNS